MVATWDDNTDDSEEKSYSNEEEFSQSVVAFVVFTNDTNDESSSESEDESKNDESELQEAFDKLFEENTSFEKLVTQLKKENIEPLFKLSKKNDDPIRDVELLKTNSNVLEENLKLREVIKQWESISIGFSLEEENQVLKHKVNSLNLRFKDRGLIINVEKENRKEKTP